jgi:uncharacterized damage-inducible protein DinB
MKTIKEYLIEKIDAELPAFVRVLEALPTDKLDWKPAPLSKTAMELATQMAAETHQMFEIFSTGKIDFDPTQFKSYASMPELVASFKEGMEKTKAELLKMSDADWEANADMMMSGKLVWSGKRGEMVWGYLLDLIHHRGQMSTYLRPMGAKVPSIYGPTADTEN